MRPQRQLHPAARLPVRLCALAAAAYALMPIAGCGDREAPDAVELTYVKHDASERRMLADRDQLERTPGVTKVIATIDDGNTITIELYVHEDQTRQARDQAVALGYEQIRN
jgi:hypothetical protein